MLITLAVLFAGFFAGTTAVLCIFLRDQKNLTKQFDTERMKLTNKAFIREGSQPLFTPEEIGGIVPDIPSTGSVPLKFTSPFNRGKQKAREIIEEQRKAEAGQNVPDIIKERIAKAAEEAKARTAA